MLKWRALLEWFHKLSDRDKVLITILICCVAICLGTFTACKIITKDCRIDKAEAKKELRDAKTVYEARIANMQRRHDEEMELQRKLTENCLTEKDVMMKKSIDEAKAERRKLEIKLERIERLLP